jgi:antitoxin (DNA-binding transcriptional repressor) of toxin-antitoxin stability system
MATVHIPETELASNLEALMAKVRAGDEVVIDSNTGPIAVLSPAPPPKRTIQECIALLPEDSTGIMDEDFAADVAAAIAFHRESLNPPAWD